MKIEETPPDHKKRFVAVFSDGQKVRFGSKHGQTYIDHNDEVKRENYVRRHKHGEDWFDPRTPGALSRWLLWGPHLTLEANLHWYKKRFANLI